MFYSAFGLEKSEQAMPLMPEAQTDLASSVPMHQLTDLAPALETFPLSVVRYPISNDESAAYFDQVQSRTLTDEYRAATNRTAVVIGESALMASLRFIPEETIIILDKSEAMCDFMRRYIDALRESDSPNEWGKKMGLFGVRSDSPEGEVVLDLKDQIAEWRGAGYTHPLMDEEVFYEVHKLALQKAIIPWHANIANRHGMRNLGQVLRDQGANVTMMNITNVMPCDDNFSSSRQYAKRLKYLPVTPNAPILTTTYSRRDTLLFMGNTVQATGPFFGLDNLAKHGGLTNIAKPDKEGSAIKRQYIKEISPDMTAGILKSLLLDAASIDKRPHGFTLDEGVVLLDRAGAERVGVQDLPPDIRKVVNDLLRDQ